MRISFSRKFSKLSPLSRRQPLSGRAVPFTVAALIGIQNIASYVPSEGTTREELKLRFDLKEEFFQEKIGVSFLPRRSEDDDIADLCARAYENLRVKTGTILDEVDCLVVCSIFAEMGAAPHVSARVQGRLGLHHAVACFDIGLGCSGYVYSLAIVQAFMQANGLKKGLLFTADPYSRIVNPKDKNTALLFGDAVTVTLISDTPQFITRASMFETRGDDGGALVFRDGSLSMNGRAVFNFAIQAVPAQIEKVLHKAGVASDDVQLFLFHQGSKFIIDHLTQRMELDPERVPLGLEMTGNTGSSSIPLLFEKVIQDPGLTQLVLCGFGAGLSCASTLLTRNA